MTASPTGNVEGVQQQDPRPTRRVRHQPVLVVFVIAAALTTLALAWWQWSAWESSAGTAQNLGYALQWPAFGFAVVWAYRRFIRLQSDPDEARRADPSHGKITEVPAGLLPERPAPAAVPHDPAPPAPGAERAADGLTIDEYNLYLAELNARDRRISDQHREQPTVDR